MSQEKFWVLLSKKLAGEAAGPELIELENLVNQHPEWQYAIQNLEDLWKHQPPKKSDLVEEDAYLLHIHRMTEQDIPFGEGPELDMPANHIRSRKMGWYWAAAATITVAAGLFIWQPFSGRQTKDAIANAESNEISTRPGSKSRVQLPDGTIVMLNAGSKLTYNKEFGKGLREVTLIGEGFFDVKKMNVPFIIHTSSINIKVLGTVFNVKAYPEDKKTETSLIRGSIEVTIKNRPNDKIILSPSEKLVVENSVLLEKEILGVNKNANELPEVSMNTLMAINKLKFNARDSSVPETQWIENKLVFRDESFDELAVKMERWYNVSIKISDPRLKEKRFSGIFENETIEQALEALKITVPYKYELEGNKIFIHR